MSRSTFASIAALVSLVNAVPSFIAPAAVASLYGVTLDPQIHLLGQLLAASYLGYAVINWTTRGSTDRTLRRGLDFGNLAAWAISAPLWIYGASIGMTNAVGWFGAGLTVAFTLGWAYFALGDRQLGTSVVSAVEPR